ncbi:hypothetical protein A2U01_0016405 [Trifolium medium]|uniref:Uncharacterized protein n=1 Tax=Trifolium medium TaxID=97028 RepID=A0A392N8B9_9FABA|nr:hypothetical protein [Trifolium medium]
MDSRSMFEQVKEYIERMKGIDVKKQVFGVNLTVNLSFTTLMITSSPQNTWCLQLDLVDNIGDVKALIKKKPLGGGTKRFRGRANCG